MVARVGKIPNPNFDLKRCQGCNGCKGCRIRSLAFKDIKVARVTKIVKVAKSKFLTSQDAPVPEVARVTKPRF